MLDASLLYNYIFDPISVKHYGFPDKWHESLPHFMICAFQYAVKQLPIQESIKFFNACKFNEFYHEYNSDFDIPLVDMKFTRMYNPENDSVVYMSFEFIIKTIWKTFCIETPWYHYFDGSVDFSAFSIAVRINLFLHLCQREYLFTFNEDEFGDRSSFDVLLLGYIIAIEQDMETSGDLSMLDIFLVDDWILNLFSIDEILHECDILKYDDLKLEIISRL